MSDVRTAARKARPPDANRSVGRGSSGSGGSSLERVTVNLTTNAVHALSRIVSLTGVSKTDAINRSLLVHAYVQEHLSKGGAVYIRDADTDEMERLQIL